MIFKPAKTILPLLVLATASAIAAPPEEASIRAFYVAMDKAANARDVNKLKSFYDEKIVWRSRDQGETRLNAMIEKLKTQFSELESMSTKSAVKSVTMRKGLAVVAVNSEFTATRKANLPAPRTIRVVMQSIDTLKPVGSTWKMTVSDMVSRDTWLDGKLMPNPKSKLRQKVDGTKGK